MGRFEVQGVVSASTGLPWVQLRQLDDNDVVESQFQLEPAQAREVAEHIHQAATNAIYEAALLSWAKEKDPEDGETMALMMIAGVRKHRADKWGLPDRPEDWRLGE